MNAYDNYMESSVLTATPLELVAMLYRCAIEAVDQAREALASGDIDTRVRSVNRAYDAVMELTFSLDHEAGGDVAGKLHELYGYISHKIIVGHGSQSDEAFAEASKLLTTMLESWELLARGEAMPQIQTDWSQMAMSA